VEKIRSLELLRCIAALLVVMFHTQTIFAASVGHVPFYGIFAAGNRGVDLFFVLSGFIIAYIHHGDLGYPKALPRYLFKRIGRIYPAVLMMTALALVMYGLGFGGAHKAAKLSPDAIVASFLLLAQHGPPLVNVTWTLTYEMFFYAVFALAIINRRLGLIALLMWQLATIVVTLGGFDLGFKGYYLRSIGLEFSVGLACAWWLRRAPGRLSALGWWVVTASGLASFAAGMALDDSISWSGIPCALGAGALIVSLVRLEQRGQIAVPAVLVMVGGASYSIYLVQYSMITLMAAILVRFHVHSTDLLCLACAATGVIGGIFFDRMFDRPVQRVLRRLRRETSVQRHHHMTVVADPIVRSASMGVLRG
jgi:exopolysaccharide production protein ExoZ